MSIALLHMNKQGNTMNRTIAYVEGFNLYFGLREKGWRRFYWLNVQLLVQNLLMFNQDLVMTKYITGNIN